MNLAERKGILMIVLIAVAVLMLLKVPAAIRIGERLLRTA